MEEDPDGANQRRNSPFWRNRGRGRPFQQNQRVNERQNWRQPGNRGRPTNQNVNNGHMEGLRQNNTRGRHQQMRYPGGRKGIGFKTLENIAQSDPMEILAKINEKKEDFCNLIKKSVEADMHILIVQILAKVCSSPFEDSLRRLLLEVCHSGYFMYLTNYILELPYTAIKERNRFYWNNQNDFWENLMLVCECILNMAPTVAMQKFRSLIEMSSKACLEELNKRHGFALSEDSATRMNSLLERFATVEKANEIEKQSRPNPMMEEEESEPPEDFRHLSVIPRGDELMERRPYLRANLIEGAYRDIEHYLDVQFRLLREDCFGGLRDGLIEFRNDPQKKKYDNMRVYRNVKFVGPYISKTNYGVLIQLDERATKQLKRINWDHSKRFIHGSLLLFSKDNCKSFIPATILDRDNKYLSRGMIPISIVADASTFTTLNILSSQESYVMFESEVYFEPYFHVLKALQEPSFVEHVAMSKYIVNVDPSPKPPEYLNPDATLKVETLQAPDTKFKVFDPATWPSHEDLSLNESQYEAYKLALTHEFAVIQGPPGTGKTYLGAKIAKTLLENISVRRNCLMLIICYTNHALDQFLEHVLKVTKSVVRIGSQSRNEAIEKISIHNLRRRFTKAHSADNNWYHQERQNLNISLLDLRRAQNQIDSLSDGILTYSCLREFVPDVELYLRHYTFSGNDKLLAWLMANANFAIDKDEFYALLRNNNLNTDNVNNDDDEKEQRTTYLVDNYLEDINEIDINGIEVETTFLLSNVESKIKQLVRRCNDDLDYKTKDVLMNELYELFYMKSIFKEMRKRYRARGVPRPVREGELLARLPNFERWCIYFTWAEEAINKIREEIAPLQEKVNQAAATYEEARMNLDVNLLRNTKVIGMTTSGAARLRKLLKALAPPIVIVEEAAEVLEQHIVTSLTKHCQHLILIGDHQQLRPSAAYMRLARHFNIEVSLFERMILNNIHSRRLRVQHRMRPQISALIAPHIYCDLEDHPSVKAFPRVRGIADNLFFYTHDYKEEAVDDSASKTNTMEADMTLSLANYLMQQGYEPEDVTILAAYSGQMFYMRKNRKEYPFLGKVKITVVDNYQGEESKIILLSLVRNNEANKIGFLGTVNRICVALSRAKEGFYIFGNIDILKRNSELWTKIATTLEDGGYVGSSIQLRCENHPNDITTISSVNDFEKVPEGGCLQTCNKVLSACGHPCPQFCHGYDRGHTSIECQLNCERIICELGHVCPLKCAEKCRKCMKKMTKTLPCGHDKKLPCHVDPATDPAHPDIQCNTTVDVTLPHCGHEAKKPCYLNVKSVACIVPCKARLEGCGHTCRLDCHVTVDPDHEKYACEKECARAKRGCTAELVGDRGSHQCTKRCHETCDDCDVEVLKKRSTCKHTERIACSKDVNEKKCRKNCARMLQCGHFCKKKCFEACGDCNEKVKKMIPECGHFVSVPCKTEPSRSQCAEACARRMACGHACAGACAAPCRPERCERPAERARFAPCGHEVRLPCHVDQGLHELTDEEKEEVMLEHCTEPCGAEQRCGHACAGSCGACRQGRLHVACASACHVTNICGHQCKEPCNQVCPPCKMKCEVKCVHSKCTKLCGAPCIPCQEPCSRKCEHGACSRRCGEPCDRPPCDLPCAAPLACGHRCRGLCGEPCPPICQQCSPDTFPKDFLGDEFDEDAKFIQLQDCSHILEVDDADNLMNGDKETISIRACPFCRQPIINTYRYKDRVNEMYRTEINPIKERVYGTKDRVQEMQNDFVAAFNVLMETHAVTINKYEFFGKAFKKLQLIIRTQRRRNSLLQLEMYFLYIKVMNMMGNKIKEYNKVTNFELREKFVKQIEIICIALIGNINKISQQQQEDISNEMKRMGSIIQLSKIFAHPSFIIAKSNPKVVEAAENAKSTVLSWKVYKEDVVMAALEKLEKEIKVTGIVTKEERDLIVKAIGLKQGHWYKCPNGHFYCIGECGGAMELGTCPECGSQIGGQSHTLLAGNSHAPEMDGSRFAAWSEQYNNMANFELN